MFGVTCKFIGSFLGCFQHRVGWGACIVSRLWGGPFKRHTGLVLRSIYAHGRLFK